MLEILASARELPEQMALAEDMRQRLDALAAAIEGGQASIVVGGGAGARVHSTSNRNSSSVGDSGGSGSAGEAKRGRGGGRGGRRGKGKRRRGGAVGGTAGAV